MASPTNSNSPSPRNRTGYGAWWGAGILLVIIVLVIIFWGFGSYRGTNRSGANVAQTNPAASGNVGTSSGANGGVAASPGANPNVGISSGTATTTSITMIQQNPNQFAGARIMVDGNVKRVIDDRTFVLGQSNTNDEILVVTRAPILPPTNRTASNPILPNDSVRVSGGVTRFSQDQLEQQLNLNWRSGTMSEWADKPVLIADSVTFGGSAPSQNGP